MSICPGFETVIEEDWLEKFRMSRRSLYKLADELTVNPDTCWRAHSSWIQIRVDVEMFESAKKNLWIQKYQGTCGGASEYSRRCGASRTSLQQAVWRRSCQTSSDGSCPFRKRLLTFLKHLGPVYMELGDPR